MTSSGTPRGFTDVERRVPGGFKDIFGPMVPGGKSRLEVPVRPAWSVSSDDAFRTWPRSRRGSTSGGSPFSSTGSSREPLIEGMNVPGFRRGVPDLPPMRRPSMPDIFGPRRPTRPLPEIPESPWRRKMKRVAALALKTTAMNAPALAAGGILGGVVGRALYEEPHRVQEIDKTQYEVSGEDQKRLAEMEAEKVN